MKHDDLLILQKNLTQTLRTLTPNDIFMNEKVAECLLIVNKEIASMTNVPDFSWIDDEFTREYCKNNFVNDETLELLKEGNILSEDCKGRIMVYNLEEGNYLHTDKIDKI